MPAPDRGAYRPVMATAARERNASPAPSGRARAAWNVLWRAFQRFDADQMTGRAAALTYYCMLSLFPGLLIGIALLGLLGGTSTVDHVASYLTGKGADAALVAAVRKTLATATTGHGGGLALAVGLATGLYGASGAFNSAGEALNVVFRLEEHRSFLRRKVVHALSTLVTIVLISLTLVLVFLGGGLAHDVFGTIGLGDTAASIWNVVRWPLAVLAAMLLFTWIYAKAPDVEETRFRCFTPGAAMAVVIAVGASAGFFFYVANFGSYNATYGAFAVAVILLVWLWLANVALLFGAELNAVLQSPAEPGPSPCPEPATPAGQEAAGPAAARAAPGPEAT